MELLTLHLSQDVLQTGRIDYILRFLNYRFEIVRSRMGQRCQHVFHVDHADNIIKRSAVNGNSRVSILPKYPGDLVERARILNCNDLSTRYHRLLDRGFGKFEYFVDQLLLFLIQMPARTRYADQLSYL